MTSRPDDDAVWQEIVENYGAEPALPEAVPPHEVDRSAEHFVPAPPPPAPVPQGPRGLAWVGVLGVPLLTLLLIALPWNVPTWLSLLLLVWFAGGFVYLVATMRGPDEDGWDDGAVV